MIAFSLFSLLVVGYRVRRGLFRKVEWALLGLVAAVGILILMQCCFAFGRFRWELPEWRYVGQASVVLYGWGVWGVMTLLSRWSRHILVAIVVSLSIYHGIMLCKSHLPFGRRAAFVRASEWAMEKIRRDYHGPTCDIGNVRSPWEYHRSNRPIVHGHNPRIGYLLGGRDESISIFGAVDMPDYWVTGHFDDGFDPGAYEFMDELTIGKRNFRLYRCRSKGGR